MSNDTQVSVQAPVSAVDALQVVYDVVDRLAKGQPVTSVLTAEVASVLSKLGDLASLPADVVGKTEGVEYAAVLYGVAIARRVAGLSVTLPAVSL